MAAEWNKGFSAKHHKTFPNMPVRDNTGTLVVRGRCGHLQFSQIWADVVRCSN